MQTAAPRASEPAGARRPERRAAPQWLEADLAAADRCATPWLAVAMHRPMYVVFPHKSNRVVGEHLRASLERLFEEAQARSRPRGALRLWLSVAWARARLPLRVCCCSRARAAAGGARQAAPGGGAERGALAQTVQGTRVSHRLRG